MFTFFGFFFIFLFDFDWLIEWSSGRSSRYTWRKPFRNGGTNTCATNPWRSCSSPSLPILPPSHRRTLSCMSGSSDYSLKTSKSLMISTLSKRKNSLFASRFPFSTLTTHSFKTKLFFFWVEFFFDFCFLCKFHVFIVGSVISTVLIDFHQWEL